MMGHQEQEMLTMEILYNGEIEQTINKMRKGEKETK